jgi:hypothetical protein
MPHNDDYFAWLLNQSMANAIFGISLFSETAMETSDSGQARKE